LSKSKASGERKISSVNCASLSEFWEVAKVSDAKVRIYQRGDETDRACLTLVK
jgi:hypothetical protein